MVISEKPRTITIPQVPSNGRFVPSFLEMHHTPESIDKIKKALTDKPKSREQVRDMSTVWDVVRPLFLRDALPGEIAQISSFTHKQVRNAIYRRRPDWHSIPRELFSKEREKERRKMAAKPGQRKRLVDRAPSSEEQVKNIEFARILLNDGFITDDLSSWNNLNIFFANHSRDLGDDFFYKLILEAFLKARQKADSGDRDLIEKYIVLGKKMDPEWFKSERLTTDRHFILDNIKAERIPQNGQIFPDDNGQRLNDAFGFLRDAGAIQDT